VALVLTEGRIGFAESWARPDRRARRLGAVREYLLTLLVAAATTYLLTPLVRRFAVAAGALPMVRDRDVHAVPTPRLGGLAMYGGLAAALLVASQLTHMRAVFASSVSVPGNLSATGSLLLAGGLIVVTGFVDDRWGMSATGKLAAQVAAGGILIWGGVELDWLPLPKGSVLSLSPRQGMVLTILLVVVTINAVNFIDGLDGLAAGVVGIAAFAFFIYSYELTRIVGVSYLTLPALVSAILAGMCLGFLPHNFYPARIFMGDTGAMLIGLVLAYATISSTANLDPATLQQVNRFPLILPLLIPVAILVIPYLDLLLAVIRRARAGMSLFAADSGHLHHRMLKIGHSHRLTVLIFYLWAGLFAFTVVMLSIVGSALAVLSVATVGGMVALLLVSMPWLRSRRPADARGAAGRRRAANAGRTAPRRRHAAGSHRSSPARDTGELPAARLPAGTPHDLEAPQTPVAQTAVTQAPVTQTQATQTPVARNRPPRAFPPSADMLAPTAPGWAATGEPPRETGRAPQQPGTGAPPRRTAPRTGAFSQQEDGLAAPGGTPHHTYINGHAGPAPAAPDDESTPGTSGKGLTKSL
jgi:UDP-GlcNAc:undecaprenyl-phosphate/decaprenyl-phosphate GlcNAc-1-phosphate transferase